MEYAEMTIANYPIRVGYEHTVERDPYGTGDSPRKHYIDVLEVYLQDSEINVVDLFDCFIENIEENILLEVM